MTNPLRDKTTGKFAGSIGSGKNQTPNSGITPTVSRTTKTKVHHEVTPEPNGCRWCGENPGTHGNRWSKAVGSHQWVTPTSDQRLARMLAKYKQTTGQDYSTRGTQNG